jgi:hypothetical protein
MTKCRNSNYRLLNVDITNKPKLMLVSYRWAPNSCQGQSGGVRRIRHFEKFCRHFHIRQLVFRNYYVTPFCSSLQNEIKNSRLSTSSSNNFQPRMQQNGKCPFQLNLQRRNFVALAKCLEYSYDYRFPCCLDFYDSFMYWHSLTIHCWIRGILQCISKPIFNKLKSLTQFLLYVTLIRHMVKP